MDAIGTSERVCLSCGDSLVMKGYEKPYQFRRRTHCGKSCALRTRARVRTEYAPATRYLSVKVNGQKKLAHRHVMEQQSD